MNRTVGTWLFHLLVSATVTTGFGLLGSWKAGAFAMLFAYLGREVTNIESELKAGGPSWTQWIDHIGDMAGPVLVAVLVHLFT